MSEFGKCKFCDREADVKFNTTPVCLEHHEAMCREARALLDKAIALSEEP